MDHVPLKVEQPPQAIALPAPEPITLVPVDWAIVPGPAPYALTADQWSNLARNLTELNRWIREAAGQLEYYRSRLTPEGDD